MKDYSVRYINRKGKIGREFVSAEDIHKALSRFMTNHKYHFEVISIELV